MASAKELASRNKFRKYKNRNLGPSKKVGGAMKIMGLGLKAGAKAGAAAGKTLKRK